MIDHRPLLHAFREWRIGKDPAETFVRELTPGEADVVAGWAMHRLAVERTTVGDKARVEVRRKGGT